MNKELITILRIIANTNTRQMCIIIHNLNIEKESEGCNGIRCYNCVLGGTNLNKRVRSYLEDISYIYE